MDYGLLHVVLGSYWSWLLLSVDEGRLGSFLVPSEGPSDGLVVVSLLLAIKDVTTRSFTGKSLPTLKSSMDLELLQRGVWVQLPVRLDLKSSI